MEAFGRVGIRDVIWLEGDSTELITTGHSDGYLAFLPDGRILIEVIGFGPGSQRRKRELRKLRRSTADGILKGIETFGVVHTHCAECGSATRATTYIIYSLAAMPC
jgi:agmatine deiminase